ncbi:hypothetical protein [Methanolobus sp. WCC5]
MSVINMPVIFHHVCRTPSLNEHRNLSLICFIRLQRAGRDQRVTCRKCC